MGSQEIALAALWFIVFLLSTTCHEAGHAWAALIGGDRTAAEAGQVSLNPLPHIAREPWGMVLVPLISYFLFYNPEVGGWMIGWASAPYNLRWRLMYPRRAGFMALAGPGANFVLVLLSVLLMFVGLKAGVFQHSQSIVRLDQVVMAEGAWSGAAAFVSILFSLNVVLGVFNLVPAPPLDGATAVGALLPIHHARRWATLTLNPTFSMVSLIFAWFVVPRYVIWPALLYARMAVLTIL